MGLKITGTGRALPAKTLTNEMLSQMVDTSDKWIIDRTGISKRQICTDETLTDLSYSAACEAIKAAGIQPEDLDYVICSTIGGDYITPSLACAIAEMLEVTCPAFDMNGACTGFIYTLDIADSLIKSGKAKKILIVCAEMMSRYADWEDRSSCVLFGDGAGACICEEGEALKYLSTDSFGNTNILNVVAGTGNSPFAKQSIKRGYLQMDGREVFKFAVTAFERHLEKALNILDLEVQEIDYFLLHQANKRIIDFARQRLCQSEDKFPTNVEKYGNMSSASILILLDELVKQGSIKKGDRLFLSAFGAGLTSGSCVIEWE